MGWRGAGGREGVAQKRLRRQQVYCISPNSINLCGALNVVCFDKVRGQGMERGGGVGRG